MKRKLPSYISTYVSVGDRDYDNVTVWFDSSPPEPDVGWPGGFDLERVMLGDRDLMGEMTDRELDDLSMRIQEDLNSYMEDGE